MDRAQPSTNEVPSPKTRCARNASLRSVKNTCQVTGVACVPNGFANFETKLVKFGGDTDSDELRVSRVLCALPGPQAFSAVSRLPPLTDLSSVGFGQHSWVPVKDVNCLSWQCGHSISDSFEIFEPFLASTAHSTGGAIGCS